MEQKTKERDRPCSLMLESSQYDHTYCRIAEWQQQKRRRRRPIIVLLYRPEVCASHFCDNMAYIFLFVCSSSSDLIRRYSPNLHRHFCHSIRLHGSENYLISVAGYSAASHRSACAVFCCFSGGINTVLSRE